MPRTRTYGLDIDTIAFATRVKVGSGKTILPENLKQINKFIIGIKKLGLWSSIICWPLRTIHNAGTGTTAYSLGGLGVYNGTLTNSPTWGFNGMSFGTTGYINVVNSTLVGSGSGSFSTGVIARSANSSSVDNNGRLLIVKADIFNLGFNQFQLMGRNQGYNGLNFRLWAETTYSTNQMSNLWNNQFKVIQAEATSGGPYAFKTSGITSGINTHTSVYNIQNNLSIKIGGANYSVLSWDGEIAFAFHINKVGYTALLETLLKQTIGAGLNMPY
jgi:hypothetical protein